MLRAPPVSWLTICPLGQPEKAIGLEPQIEPWLAFLLPPSCLSHQKPKPSSRQQHESAKKANPKSRSTLHGLESRAQILLLPVAGEFFLLTLPFIERGYLPCRSRYPSFRLQQLKEAKNTFAPEFRLVAMPADMANDEECVSVSEQGSRKQSKEKFYATAFREKRGGEQVMLLVWTQERGYWKIIAIRLEDSSDTTIVPRSAAVQVEPVEQEPPKIGPDPTAVNDITQFYQAWIAKRNTRQALPFVSRRSYQCLTPSSEDQRTLAPLARIQLGLEQPLNEIPLGKHLSEMMSNVQPVNENLSHKCFGVAKVLEKAAV